MKPQNIVFLGSKPIGFWCFQHLLECKDQYKINIIGVRSKENPNLEHKSLCELARENSIRVLSNLDELSALDEPIDYIFSVQHHEILTHTHLNTARILAANLHMAPLPEYRGCNQFSYAIIDQAKVFGTTLHQMLPGIDNGSILFERRFSIAETITVKELYNLTEIASKELWAESLGKILSGNYNPITQDALISTRGTSIHYRSDINKLKQIDINWAQEKIERHIRATYMPGFSPPYSIINGKKVSLVPEEPKHLL